MAANNQALLMAGQATGIAPGPAVCVADPYYSCGPTADPYWNQVIAVLHCNGANNSTTFTDNAATPKTWTANATAKLSTSQVKFGTAAGSFSGGTDYVSASASSDWALGAGDFTIECWIWLSSSALGGGGGSFYGIAGNGTGAGKIDFHVTPSAFGGNTLRVYGDSGNISTGDVNAPIPTDSWSHAACVRQNGVISLYLNGQQISQDSSAAFDLSDTTPYRFSSNYIVNSWLGYLDDLRITKGIARYTGNFNIPTAAFPDSLAPTIHDETKRRLWKDINIVNRVHNSVCYGNGKFVIGDTSSGNAVAQYSSDGVTWADSNTITGSGYGLKAAFGGGLFFAYINAVLCATSVDGVTWTARTTPGFSATCVPFFGNGYFVLTNGSNNTTLYTADGITYFNGGTTPGASYSGRGGAYGNGIYVAVESAGLCYTTNLANNWTGVTPSGWNQRSCIYFGGGKFIALSSSTTTAYHYSVDGSSWTQGTLPVNAQWSAVTYSNGYFLATAINSKKVAVSSDGASWTLVATENQLTDSDGADLLTVDGAGNFVALSASSSVPAAMLGVATELGYPRTILSAHADNSSDSSCYQPKTITFGGSAAVSTAQKKFGTGSFAIPAGANRVVVAAHQDFQFGTGDFTIEMWAYLTAFNSGTMLLYDARTGEPQNNIAIQVSTAGAISVLVNGTTFAASATGVITTGSWQFVVVQRSGTTLTIYVGGTSVGSATVSNSLLGTSIQYVGGRYDNTSTASWNGYIDEVRVTRGVARYSATFTPASLVNCDSTSNGVAGPPGTERLSGVSMTATAGDIPTGSPFKRLTGQSATANAGTLSTGTQIANPTLALTGTGIASARGSVSVGPYPTLSGANQVDNPTRNSDAGQPCKFTIAFFPTGQYSYIVNDIVLFSGNWIGVSYDITSISNAYQAYTLTSFTGPTPTISSDLAGTSIVTVPRNLNSAIYFTINNTGAVGSAVPIDFQVKLARSSLHPDGAGFDTFGGFRFNATLVNT